MFYLNHFFKCLWHSKIKGFLYFVFLLLSVLFWGQKDKVDIFVHKMSSGGEFSGTYFNALVDSSENISRISRKILDLPGVRSATILNESEIKDRTLRMLEELGIGGDGPWSRLQYSGLKVTFDVDTSVRSQELIREYMERLVGAEKIILGPTTIPKTNPERVERVATFKSWVKMLVLILPIFFWLVIGFLIREEYLRLTYVTEKYQRKTALAFKSLIFGNMFLLVLATLVGVMSTRVLSAQYLVVLSSMLVMQSLLISKRRQWES